ncbi:MAG: hypothetical protein PHD70_10300 [Anaerostipes sp.]|nr:hypothetical protein [Anaerostipes sp.]MDD3746848.1 hypothetical protein [Anaerostipes sp.]
MSQNEMLILVTVVGCLLCILYGIYKRPGYFFVLLGRGILCSLIVYGICSFCRKNGLVSPVDLNLISIGTGALLGFPGIMSLYIIGIFLV